MYSSIILETNHLVFKGRSNNVWIEIQDKSKAFLEILCRTIYQVNANVSDCNPI